MRARALLLLVCTALAGVQARALTDEEVFREFRYNLTNPGARSMAMGGAFISLADDATAAQANPAGLSYLLRREYFVEFRAVDSGGDAQFVNERLPTGIETSAGFGTNREDVESISFASMVFPLRNFTLGVSIQEVLNTQRETLNRFSIDFSNPPALFLVDGTGFIDINQTNFNVSGGMRVSDRLAFGISLVASRMDVRSELKNFVLDTDGTITGTRFTTPTLDIETSIDDSDIDVTFNAGVIARPWEGISLGAVYRRGARFAVDIEPSPGVDLFGLGGRLQANTSNRINTPDVYGVGASWQVRPTVTVALDVERIEYTDLLSGFVTGVNVLTGTNAEFTVDDATEVRLGGEWVIFPVRRFPVALRGGLFTQSDNRLRAVDTGQKQILGGSIPFASEDLFPAGDREIHGTAGVGLNWPRLKLDLAFDYGKSDNEFVVSAIFQGR